MSEEPITVWAARCAERLLLLAMIKYGKPFKDYDPCEECNAEECGSCKYYGAGNERKTDQDDSGE